MQKYKFSKRKYMTEQCEISWHNFLDAKAKA